MDALLAGAIATYIYLTNAQGIVAPEAFEFDNLACTVSSRQGDDILLGCGPLLPPAGSPAAGTDALTQIRKRYPEYAGLADPALKDAVRRKYFPSLGPKEFESRLPAIAAELTGAGTMVRAVMTFGGSIRELAPNKGEEESWAVALRLLPNLRCARWQGKYWRCRLQPGAPAPAAAPDSSSE